jgi:uncharacterized protein (DUF58 family)
MAEIQHSPKNAADYRLPTILIIPVIQIMAAVFLLIALLNGHRELTVLLLLAIGILAAAKIWRHLSTSKIDYDTNLDKHRVFPGEKLSLTTRVRNAKFLPVLAEISASFTESFHVAHDPEDLKKSCSLLWFQEATFKWPLVAGGRGIYQIGPAELKVGDLFGFYSSKLDSESVIEVIVYPRLIPLKPLRLPRLEMFGIPGVRSPIEDPVYVHGTREYQSGRPARYIHWKASARLSRLQEKICEPAAQEKVLLIIDVDCFCRHQAHLDFEKTLEVAGSLAVDLDRDGIAVGLATNAGLRGGGSSIVPIGRGGQQITRILETLARLRITPACNLRQLLMRRLRLPYGTTIINLAYDLEPSGSDLSAFFQRRRQPAVSIVCHREPRPGTGQKPRMVNVLTIEDVCG